MELESKEIKTNRSTSGLRDVLFEELDNLRSGRTTPARANAVARVTSQIIGTSKAELEYAKFIRDLGAKDDTIQVIRLN